MFYLSSNEKPAGRPSGFVPRKESLEKFEDMMGEDHENDVEDPNDVPPEDQTNQSANPMPFFETSHKAEDPRSDGDNAKDQRDDPG